MPRIKAISSGDGGSGWARLREFLSAHLLLLLLLWLRPLRGTNCFQRRRRIRQSSSLLLSYVFSRRYS